jgi:hypothetical protein
MMPELRTIASIDDSNVQSFNQYENLAEEKINFFWRPIAIFQPFRSEHRKCGNEMRINPENIA